MKAAWINEFRRELDVIQSQQTSVVLVALCFKTGGVLDSGCCGGFG